MTARKRPPRACSSRSPRGCFSLLIRSTPSPSAMYATNRRTVNFLSLPKQSTRCKKRTPSQSMGHKLRTRTIHLLSVPRCSSVVRFSDFVMTALEGQLPHPQGQAQGGGAGPLRPHLLQVSPLEPSSRSQHLNKVNGNRLSVSSRARALDQSTRLAPCVLLHLLSSRRC